MAPDEPLPDDAPGDEPSAGAAPAAGQTPFSWRRRLALPVLVLGVAAALFFWQRRKPAKLRVTVDLGRRSDRVSRLRIEILKGDEVLQPIEASYPTPGAAPRRYRHNVQLDPGTYDVRARIWLRASGSKPESVRRLHRRITLSGNDDRRLTFRLH